jgi:hypothetical protein
MRSLEEVQNYFVYHAPTEDQRHLYERMNNMWQQVAEMIWEMVPPFNQGSPDKTVVFRELMLTRMLANAAVACFNEPPISGSPEAQGPSESPGQEPVSRP